MSSTVQINGVSYTGSNISLRGNRLKIDGKEVDTEITAIMEVRILGGGKIDKLETDASVNCMLVVGSVSAGGSVNCDDVGGNVSAGGSVNCDDVGGNVSAGGSVRSS